jgi:hypothetical protein
MDEEYQRRVARNEAIFRDVNEAISGGRWPGDEDALIAFRCECGRLGCNRMLRLAAGDYERIRANPRRFLVALEHDIPEAETVVEAHEHYLVLEKRDEAARVAEESDPRS